MKRRLNLGAALVHEPRLIFLDEPTTGVDPQSRNHIFQEIRRLSAAGITLIYTSHYMEEVQSLCPRIAIMDHGRAVACDTRENLLRRLPGQVRLRLPRPAPDLVARLATVPATQVRPLIGNDLEIECPETSRLLKEVVPWLHELGLSDAHLEVTEPNLESVFLKLTGHGLRD
jgi:ABC-2 type transport system ATP-binding protein